MADSEIQDDTVDENILYDLTIHAEWQQEPETTNRIVKEKSQVSITAKLTSAAYRSTWTFLRSVGVPSSTSPCSLPVGLVKLVSSQMNWHIAVTLDGRNVAVLQEQVLEIRSSRDEYSSVIGRCSVARDPYPQWRRLAWSPEGDMVACSDSTGKVQVFDLFGTAICTLPCGSQPKPNTPTDLSSAVAGLVFKEYKGTDNWSVELLVINYQGALRRFLLGRDGDKKELAGFTFVGEYPRGVSAVLYHPAHNLLYVGGLSDPDPQTGDRPSPRQYGITSWRCLSDFPHFKLVTDYEEDKQRAQKMQIVRRLQRIRSRWAGDNQDGVYRLSISPDGSSLAAVHHSGRFSLWDLPSLRMRRTWTLEQQPGHDEVNQEVAENPKRRKTMKEFLHAYYLVDANWWSSEAVILARGTGALSVCSANNLRNLLGTSPEWFEPGPLITAAQDGGFLGLECECKHSTLKRRLVEEDDNEYEDTDDEEDATMVTKSTKYVKQVLYFVTDSERFQPPRKRPKLITKTYRLVCLKSTTPEELYARKIDNEEYGEALALAKAYGLDCDLVYQRQWRKTPVSVASIQDYLSKISKRSWVLHECIERVPENIDAMKELLQYGLRGTDLEALIAIGNHQDGGRFILCDRGDVYEDSLDMYDEEAVEEARLKEEQNRLQLLEQVNFQSLTLEQKELCRARMKLLQYLDRLATYEEILGGIHAAEERFDPVFYQTFRSQNIVELATEYARACDWRALDMIFTYHGKHTLPHRLTILANFPETFPPHEYRALLPEAGGDNDPDVLAWEEQTWRDKDWCEEEICQNVINPSPLDHGLFLYETQPDLQSFRGVELSSGQLMEWYRYRACEIEELSSQVDHALQLVDLAMERYVTGLDLLHDDLVTMETLVYECAVDESMTFSKFQKMSDLEKLQLMMSKSSEEMYVKNVRRWLLPFLRRCEKHTPGSMHSLMRDYLLGMAETDLLFCCLIFESSKANVANPVMSETHEMMSLAMECVYACTDHNQLSNAFAILECLPQRGFGVVSEKSARLHNQVDELEGHLGAAEILENNFLPHTIAQIRDMQDDPEKTLQLLTKLTRQAGRRSPPLSEKDWKKVLLDLLALTEKAFHSVQPNVCYEMFVESLLCSGRHETIRLAGEMMERSSVEALEPDYLATDSEDAQLLHKVAYAKSVELVLSAAREYFDSSANLTDPCMDLARACLSLISDQPSEIIEERDLIDSLALLDGFGVTMLPIQVRICQDRLELIQKSLDAKPYTYKNAQRLLKLGLLLRVESESEADREGQILKLLAQTAIKSKDNHVAYETCKKLMKSGYPPVWTECKALAESEHFQDIQAKAELLSFAVTHCTPEMIEPILRAKCLLETQILYERVHSQVQDRESASPGENPFTARGAISQTREILTSTTQTTKAVLSTVSDKKWWKKTLHSLKSPGRSVSFVDVHDDRNVDFEKQGCHPFYESVMPGAYYNKSEGDYRNYRLPKLHAGAMDLSEVVLRTGKLEETLTEGDTVHPSTEVLQQLAGDILAQDTMLGLAYLLALPGALDANKCFTSNPSTAISLQIAAYYYAIQIYSRLESTSQPSQKPLYSHDPSEVIKMVVDHVTKQEEADWPAEVAELVPQLKHYEELLMDFNQAQVLQGLGRGVDVGRFTQDSEYKRETILGLAITQEQDVYEIAVSLAQRYKMSLWEIYMTHLEHLFDSGMPTQDIEARIRELAILPTLLSQPENFAERMKKYVFPTLEGTDHVRLMYYYTLLDGCESADETITSDVHIRLLKKLKPAAPGLDYKKLMSGKFRPMDIIQPVLNSGNVHVIAKLAAKIPDPVSLKGGFLQPSVVFCAWATRVFWQGEPGHKREPQSTSDWVHRYESCRDYENKMTPADFINFLDSIIFVPMSLEQLTVECRQEIVKRALKFSRQSGAKKKKHEDTGDMSWEAASVHLQQSASHLEQLHSDTLVALQESQDEHLNRYAQMYDLSRSQTNKLEELLVQVVLDGQDPSVVEDLLQVAAQVNWTPQTAVREAISVLIQSIKNGTEANERLGGVPALNVLKNIVQVVSEHNKEGGVLVAMEDVMMLLRPFCADVTVDVQPRLDALRILEQSFDLGEEDLAMLILYRTDALVTASWEHVKVNQADVSSDVRRHALFKQLLDTAESMDQFTNLTKLLQVWPPLEATTESVDDPSNHPWCELIGGAVAKCGEVASGHIIDIVNILREYNPPLSQKCLEEVFSLLKSHQMALCGVKCVLQCEHVDLYDLAIQELASHQQPWEDEELLLLLLKRHLAASIVKTEYYSKLVTYILANQAPEEEPPYYLSVDEIANQLQDQGYEAEAGSLLMQQRGMHSSLRTFDAAINVLSKWFSR